MPRPKIDTERREQILEALEIVVLKEGLAKTTLSKVAVLAGLPRPLIRYYAGNRDSLIQLLFDRVFARSEDHLDKLQPQSGVVSTERLVDLFVQDIFADKVMNQLMKELWFASGSSPSISEGLQALYQRVCATLCDSMARDGLGHSDADRFDRAFSIVALCFGATSFGEIALHPNDPDRIRATARAILLTENLKR